MDDIRLFGFAEIVVERQAQQAIADILGDRAVAGLAAEPPPHIRQVQRQVVEHR